LKSSQLRINFKHDKMKPLLRSAGKRRVWINSRRFLKSAAHGLVRPLLNAIRDTVFPAKCLICSRFFQPTTAGSGNGPGMVALPGVIDSYFESYKLLAAYCCSGCVTGFSAISAPLCACCGIMFKSGQNENHLCGDCITQPKKFRMARAALVYDHQLMAVIHRFKYNGKIQLARPLGGLMLGAFVRYWHNHKIDLVLPVPLHAKKFRKRGFNQSYLLLHSWTVMSMAMPIEFGGISVNTDALIRSKATPPQTGLGRQQRLKNIRRAFSVRASANVEGKRILLVDDVYTTGATVNECARVLLVAGAQLVDVLTLARAI
jgi:ComF family protein